MDTFPTNSLSSHYVHREGVYRTEDPRTLVSDRFLTTKVLTINVRLEFKSYTSSVMASRVVS